MGQRPVARGLPQQVLDSLTIRRVEERGQRPLGELRRFIGAEQSPECAVGIADASRLDHGGYDDGIFDDRLEVLRVHPAFMLAGFMPTVFSAHGVMRSIFTGFRDQSVVKSLMYAATGRVLRSSWNRCSSYGTL